MHSLGCLLLSLWQRKRKQAEYRKAKLHSEFYRKHQRDQEKEEKEIAKDPVAGRRMKFYESVGDMGNRKMEK